MRLDTFALAVAVVIVTSCGAPRRPDSRHGNSPSRAAPPGARWEEVVSIAVLCEQGAADSCRRLFGAQPLRFPSGSIPPDEILKPARALARQCSNGGSDICLELASKVMELAEQLSTQNEALAFVVDACERHDEAGCDVLFEWLLRRFQGHSGPGGQAVDSPSLTARAALLPRIQAVTDVPCHAETERQRNADMCDRLENLRNHELVAGGGSLAALSVWKHRNELAAERLAAGAPICLEPIECMLACVSDIRPACARLQIPKGSFGGELGYAVQAGVASAMLKCNLGNDYACTWLLKILYAQMAVPAETQPAFKATGLHILQRACLADVELACELLHDETTTEGHELFGLAPAEQTDLSAWLEAQCAAELSPASCSRSAAISLWKKRCAAAAPGTDELIACLKLASHTDDFTEWAADLAEPFTAAFLYYADGCAGLHEPFDLFSEPCGLFRNLRSERWLETARSFGVKLIGTCPPSEMPCGVAGSWCAMLHGKRLDKASIEAARAAATPQIDEARAYEVLERGGVQVDPRLLEFEGACLRQTPAEVLTGKALEILAREAVRRAYACDAPYNEKPRRFYEQNYRRLFLWQNAEVDQIDVRGSSTDLARLKQVRLSDEERLSRDSMSRVTAGLDVTVHRSVLRRTDETGARPRILSHPSSGRPRTLSGPYDGRDSTGTFLSYYWINRLGFEPLSPSSADDPHWREVIEDALRSACRNSYLQLDQVQFAVDDHYCIGIQGSWLRSARCEEFAKGQAKGSGR